MYKIWAVVTVFMLSLFQFQVFAADLTPGLAKTKDIVRLSLWYEGVSLSEISARNKEIIRPKIEFSQELTMALIRAKK